MNSLTIHHHLDFIVVSHIPYNIHFAANLSDMQIYVVLPIDNNMKYLNDIGTIIIKCGVTLRSSATILLSGLLL